MSRYALEFRPSPTEPVRRVEISYLDDLANWLSAVASWEPELVVEARGCPTKRWKISWSRD